MRGFQTSRTLQRGVSMKNQGRQISQRFFFFFLLSFEVLMEKGINTDSTKISAKCYKLCFLFLSTVLDQ